MTTRDGFDRQLTTWLDSSAGAAAPDYLDETLSAIDNLHQRPAWAFPGRWLPMTLDVRWTATARPIAIFAILALLLVAGLLALAVGGSRPRVPTELPPPFGLARPGLLVFDMDRQIVLANPDGSGIHPLHASDRYQYGGTFSRDGTRVAFWQEDAWVEIHGGVKVTADLWVVDVDGSRAMNLTPDLDVVARPYSPVGSWSPDGSAIAFTAEKDGRMFVVATDGSTSPRAIGDEPLLRMSPAWAPDGSSIAFTGMDLGADGDLLPTSVARVYVIGPDGTGLDQVSRGRAGGETLRWSPDGRMLLYDGPAADRDAPPAVDAQGNPVPPTGREPRGLVVAERGPTGWTERVVVEDSSSWLASFSNDGTRIAFLRSRPDVLEGDLFIVGVDGSGERMVSDRLVNVSSPCWSPDDRTIAMLTGPNPPGDFLFGWPDQAYALFPVDGGRPVEIPAATVFGIAACSWQRLAP